MTEGEALLARFLKLMCMSRFRAHVTLRANCSSVVGGHQAPYPARGHVASHWGALPRSQSCYALRVKVSLSSNPGIFTRSSWGQ